jgi:hypothetical protein
MGAGRHMRAVAVCSLGIIEILFDRTTPRNRGRDNGQRTSLDAGLTARASARGFTGPAGYVMRDGKSRQSSGRSLTFGKTL